MMMDVLQAPIARVCYSVYQDLICMYLGNSGRCQLRDGWCLEVVSVGRNVKLNIS